MADETEVGTGVEDMMNFLGGNMSQEDFQKTIDLNDSDTEASQTSTDDDEAAKVAETQKATDDAAIQEEAGKVAADKKEAEVLAKDGKHTLPFKVVEDLREEVRLSREQNASLQAAMEEQKGLLEMLQVAKKEDAGTGTTDAVDEVLGDLAEDYPGAVAAIKEMLAPLAELKADREKSQAEQAATAAQTDYEAEITSLNKDFPQIIASDEYWTWFNSQPSFVKAAHLSGDPQQVADVVTMYQSQIPAVDSDKSAQAENVRTDAAAKVKAAIDKASGKNVVQTLSDIPATQNPAVEEAAAMEGMSPVSLMMKMMSMDQKGREEYLSKTL